MSETTTVFLVRHGETVWAAERRVHGRIDVALSERGRARAAELADLFRPLPLADVIASPLARARRTADAIGAPHGIDVCRDPRLTDLDAGRWSGRRYEELAVDAEFRPFFDDVAPESSPGGESLAQVLARVRASVEQAVADNPGGAVVVVSHAGPLRVYLTHLAGGEVRDYPRLRLPLGSISVVRFDGDGGARVVATGGMDLGPGLGVESGERPGARASGPDPGAVLG